MTGSMARDRSTENVGRTLDRAPARAGFAAVTAPRCRSADQETVRAAAPMRVTVPRLRQRRAKQAANDLSCNDLSCPSSWPQRLRDCPRHASYTCLWPFGVFTFTPHVLA